MTKNNLVDAADPPIDNETARLCARPVGPNGATLDKERGKIYLAGKGKFDLQPVVVEMTYDHFTAIFLHLAKNVILPGFAVARQVNDQNNRGNIAGQGERS